MKKHKNLFIVLAIILVASISIIIATSEKNNNIYKENESIKKSYSNGIAMMLETEAGSGNYEMTTRDTWPTDGYIFNSNLSKCENGGELSWDDENKRVLMRGTVSDKCYVYFDVKPTLLADYVKALYTGTQGENNIYYHDADLANGAGDNSYRYAGASESVNNYTCLGSTESPCPDANLFRIIGVFGDQVKVIRATSVGDMKRDSNSSNTWSTASLNAYLNGEYLTSLGTLSEKIATTTWKVGGNTYANIASQTAATAYANEITNAVTTNTTDNATEYSAKIGLMYVSDYGFAADPSTWTTTLSKYNGSVNGSTIPSLNWLYLGSSEWTISRSAVGSDVAFSVFSSGLVYHDYVTNYFGVRPSFNLVSSINYVSGSGSASDPIVIN